MADGPHRPRQEPPAAAGGRAAFDAQARLLISPQLPAKQRDAVLRDRWAFEVDADRTDDGILTELVDLARDAAQPAWWGSALLVALLAVAGTAAIRQLPHLLGEGDSPLFPAWVVALVPVVGLLGGVLVTLLVVARGRRDAARARRAVGRWSDHVISKDRQQRAAASFPELGRRLGELYALVDRLHGYDALLADGWLPGLSPAKVDELHYALTERLLSTVPQRSTLAEARSRPALAGQTAAAQTQLAAFDAAIDEDLDRLRQLSQAAAQISGQLADLRVAERLDATSPAGDALRDHLPAPAEGDLPALTAAAHDSAALVRAALDPQRLHPPVSES